MAYCKQCGAYIPDGQSKCLACGYDDTVSQAQSGAAYAYEAQNRPQPEDEIRAEVERRRAERQENARVWAEKERARRQREEQFKQRQAEAEHRAESYVNRSGPAERGETGTGQLGSGRGLAMLSYLGILFIIPLLLGQEDDFVKFHAREGMRLFLYSAIGTGLGALFSVGWIVTILGIILSVIGIGNALNGRRQRLPILDKLNWF